MTGVEIRDLIASLIDSLAWPVVVLITLSVLCPHLGTLVSLLSSIRYKDLELVFRRAVQDTTEKAASFGAVDADELAYRESLPEVLDRDPRIAVLKSWALVETAIEDLARAHQDDLGLRRRVPTYKRVDALRSASLIDPSLAGLLHDMRATRNLIAHGRDIHIDDDTVRAFARAVAHVATVVQQQLKTR